MAGAMNVQLLLALTVFIVGISHISGLSGAGVCNRTITYTETYMTKEKSSYICRNVVLLSRIVRVCDRVNKLVPATRMAERLEFFCCSGWEQNGRLGCQDSRYIGCRYVTGFEGAMRRGPLVNGSLCILSCRRSKLAYASTVHGDTCYCHGTDWPEKDSVTKESMCNVPCQGHPLEICGGTGENMLGQYPGSTYRAVCTEGRFGVDCTGVCHCSTGGCDSDTGFCTKERCAPGWDIPPKCQDVCKEGRCGADCSRVCRCSTGSCDPKTCACDNIRCEPGWGKPSVCQDVCEKGTFGVDCAGVCHCNRGGCGHVNGSCYSKTCAPGWTNSPYCQDECPFGKFGPSCSKTCPCFYDPCDHVTGKCIHQWNEHRPGPPVAGR